jgi:hypothetical protein
LLGGLFLAAFAGCVTESQPPARRMIGESVVCIGEEPAALAFRPLASAALTARSTYRPGTDTVDYVAGRDYSVDFKNGTLRRLPGSRLPDFRQNMLFGQTEFDHSKFPGFGNNGFFAFKNFSSKSNRE